MKAALKRFDLEALRTDRLELPDGPALVTAGRAPDNDLVLPGARPSRRQFQLVSDGGPWRLEDAGSAGGTFLGGQRITSPQALNHGDGLVFHPLALVFCAGPEARNAALEANLDQQPGDGARVKVWADWLLEHGDPLGEEIARGVAGPVALEGLDPLVANGTLELGLEHGLIRAATLRLTEHRGDALLAAMRLCSLRAARWLKHLTVDSSDWRTAGPEALQPRLLSWLASAPGLPALESLFVGYTAGDRPSAFLDQLVKRITQRFPSLRTPAEEVFLSEQHASLEVLEVPPGLDFHHAWGAGLQRLPLGTGLWVGSSQEGSLRALSPGVRREGLSERFVIETAHQGWELVPCDARVTLNGHAAMATRLLPGDVIAEPGGAKFKFVLER